MLQSFPVQLLDSLQREAGTSAGSFPSASGGGGGIRTHEDFRPAGFQDRSHQPLDHPSGCVRMPILASGSPMSKSPLQSLGSSAGQVVTCSHRTCLHGDLAPTASLAAERPSTAQAYREQARRLTAWIHSADAALREIRRIVSRRCMCELDPVEPARKRRNGPGVANAILPRPARRRSSRATTAPTSASRRASIPTAVANTAAFTASRGRRTSISASPPGSISRARSW